jgi:hypothetical protein
VGVDVQRNEDRDRDGQPKDEVRKPRGGESLHPLRVGAPNVNSETQPLSRLRASRRRQARCTRQSAPRADPERAPLVIAGLVLRQVNIDTHMLLHRVIIGGQLTQRIEHGEM